MCKSVGQWSVLFAALAIASGALSACSSGMSGGELYDACSLLHVDEDKLTSDQKIRLERCKKLAERIFYDAGLVYVGEEPETKIQELKKYCPAAWTSPIGGPYVFLVQYWDKNGMSYFERYFKSADAAAKSVFLRMYPRCPAMRHSAGVPKITDY